MNKIRGPFQNLYTSNKTYENIKSFWGKSYSTRYAISPKIRPEQFFFHSEYSTTQPLIKFNQLCVNANKKEFTTAAFLDVEKAFDRGIKIFSLKSIS